MRNLDTATPLVEQYGNRVEAIQIDLEKPETISSAAKRAEDVEELWSITQGF